MRIGQDFTLGGNPKAEHSESQTISRNPDRKRNRGIAQSDAQSLLIRGPRGQRFRCGSRSTRRWPRDGISISGSIKDTKLTERFALQIRAEAFNVFNHANLYTEGLTADVGASNTVEACYGCSGSASDRRQVQLTAKVIF